MITLTIKKLAEVIGAVNPLDGDLSEKNFSGVCIDSREIKDGNCFFAIKGENFDGSDFIDAAFEKGAACVIALDGCEQKGKAILTVSDTITAMGDLARWYRNELKAKVVAITGSVGKTTVRELVCHVLSKHFKCHQSPKSFNNNLGLPLTLLSAQADDDIIIAELGSNAPGEIEYLTKIAQPDIALVNNTLPAHLEGFGSVDSIIKEKTSIVSGLKPEGEFIVNGDIPELVEYCKSQGYVYTTFGESAGCDVRVENIVCKPLSGVITIDGMEINIPAAGKGNLLNALAGWAICKKIGITLEQFADAVATFKPVGMRMQIEKFRSTSNGAGITVINDCYNANPASMVNALGCLEQLAQNEKSRSVFICGTMAELGDKSEFLHGEIGKTAAEKNVDLILAVGKFTEALINAARKHSKGAVQDEIFENTDQLCGKLEDLVRQDDIILVKGSRSVKLELAVSRLKEMFS